MSNRNRLSSTTSRLTAVLLFAGAVLAFPALAQANPTIPGSTTGTDGAIWMPNYGNGSVVAFDPGTLDVVATIPNVGDHPLVIKELPDHSKMFVGNFGPANWNVSVIDVESQTVIKQIPTFGAAYAVSQLSHDSRYLFVPTSLSVMQVIDTQSLEVIRTLPIALPPGPAHLELSPDDTAVYVFSAVGTATKYDAISGAMLAPPIFLDGFFPGWGALSVDGNTMYAVNYISGLTTIDTRTWQVTKVLQMPIAAGPLSATLTPDGTRLWMCNYMNNEILVFDTTTGEIVQTITTDQAPVYVGFSSDGTKAYVSLVDGASGIAAQMYLPFLPGGEQASLGNAYAANLIGLETSLASYDTARGTMLDSNSIKGALVAGVYPG
ncbi:YncE family protein [Rhodococcus qingshengii]|uniref:YncE family protein n=1 Tax=Rhodococcus qingshengii TaxID=334542 RepID=UPI001ADFF3B9|nr:hypothetical protein [Rhodococcus qingshengii]